MLWSVTGVGQHQIVVGAALLFQEAQTASSLQAVWGPWALKLPAAIGAKIGCPNETVWCMAGDGSLQMTIQELATAARRETAIKIAILNNGYLGMVRQWQEMFFGKRLCCYAPVGPDFVKIAEAYGIPGLR